MREDVMKCALVALKNELEKEPISPERVAALSEAIKALSGINSLSRF